MKIYKVKDEYIELLQDAINFNRRPVCSVCGRKTGHDSYFLTTTDFIGKAENPEDEKQFAEFAEELGSGYEEVRVGNKCFEKIIIKEE